MKKILLAFLCAITCMTVSAQDKFNYTDNLVVTINDFSTDPQPTTVTLSVNEDGTCSFLLKNFVLDDGESVMGVGNINIENIPAEFGEDNVKFSYKGNLQIENGDLESVDMWMGPFLGDIPLDMTGEATEDKIYVSIDIDMSETLGQIIHVEFGTPFEESGALKYTDNLVVTINDFSTDPQPATVTLTVNEEDSSCSFLLKNFVLDDGESVMGVGNINIENIPAEFGEDNVKFSYKGNLQIENGDLESVDMWMGPFLGDIPLDMTGEATEDKIYVSIDIDMSETLEQIIHVEFGTPFDTPTAINQAVAKAITTAVYNLAGRRINNNTRGICIVNGKKVMR